MFIIGYYIHIVNKTLCFSTPTKNCDFPASNTHNWLQKLSSVTVMLDLTINVPIQRRWMYIFQFYFSYNLSLYILCFWSSLVTLDISLPLLFFFFTVHFMLKFRSISGFSSDNEDPVFSYSILFQKHHHFAPLSWISYVYLYENKTKICYQVKC
jgi:hypothetical protein